MESKYSDMKPFFIREKKDAHLEINEVTTGASLSTKTSPTTKSTTQLINSVINLEKSEYLC
jgi:hypothetical protein